MFKKDKSVLMSTPEVKTIHGIEIKKLPIGKYIKLSQYSVTLIPDILEAISPDLREGEIALKLPKFLSMTTDELMSMLIRIVTTIPEKICEVVSALLDIEKSQLLDEHNGITPVELMEILVSLWEANDLSSFFPLGRQLLDKIGLSAQTTGSKDGSELPQK